MARMLPRDHRLNLSVPCIQGTSLPLVLRLCCPSSARVGLLPPEVHEHPAEVVRVLLHPVVERFDLLLIQKAQHVFLQGAGALSGDDLDQRRLLADRLVDDGAQRAVDIAAVVVDVMQVELQFHSDIAFRPHAEIIGEVARSRRPLLTLTRCRASSVSVAIPAAISASRTCSTVARSSSEQAGPPIGKYASDCTSSRPASRSCRGSVLP